MQVCSVEPLEVKNVGKIVKTSKRRYLWCFKVHDGNLHPACQSFEIELTDSQVSKKRNVKVNGTEVKVDTQLKGQQFGDYPVIVMTVPIQAYLLRQNNTGHQYDLYLEGQRYQDLVQIGQTMDAEDDLFYKGKSLVTKFTFACRANSFEDQGGGDQA